MHTSKPNWKLLIIVAGCLAGCIVMVVVGAKRLDTSCDKYKTECRTIIINKDKCKVIDIKTNISCITDDVEWGDRCGNEKIEKCYEMDECFTVEALCSEKIRIMLMTILGAYGAIIAICFCYGFCVIKTMCREKDDGKDIEKHLEIKSIYNYEPKCNKKKLKKMLKEKEEEIERLKDEIEHLKYKPGGEGYEEAKEEYEELSGKWYKASSFFPWIHGTHYKIKKDG